MNVSTLNYSSNFLHIISLNLTLRFDLDDDDDDDDKYYEDEV